MGQKMAELQFVKCVKGRSNSENKPSTSLAEEDEVQS